MEYTIGTKVFDGWEITRLLGEGSYGKVYAIEKTDFGFTARAALKVIRIPKSPAEIREALSDGMDDKSVTTYFEEIVERFVREIAVMSQLKGHPNVVSCENYKVEPHAGSIGWDILIKMELLTSLSDYQLAHPMTEADARCLAEQMCRALMFIQKQGLIHRDIKPANIFVDNLGQFKLGDFGVARTADTTMGGMSKQGTENYMAPEVYHGKPYGVTVDIYSLGLVLYRIMNGKRLPFFPPAPQHISLADRENALNNRMKGVPLPPPADASPEFAEIILKACAHDPRDRYRTAAEMLEALIGKADSVVAPPEIGIDVGRGDPPAPVPPDEDEGGGTVNIFGKKSIPPVPNPQDDDEDSGTVNIFGKKPVPPVPNPPDDDEDGGTVNIFGKKPVPPIPDPVEEDHSREDAMREFWKKNMAKLWSEKVDPNWKVYVSPGIPLQICSNAIFNIAQNLVKKDQILAILDCTPDTRVPCGCGVVVTSEKMYINLLISGADARKFPGAILEFDRLKRVWSGVRKGPLWAKYPSLYWETKDGRTGEFGMNMYRFLNYSTLADLLSSKEWQDCLKHKKQ